MDLLENLNAEQSQAVTRIEGPTMIIAGAGTGKTKVITHRIAYMLANGIQPQAICAVTFTNKAANEMKERLAGLSRRPVSGMAIGTFHRFCLNILRQHPKSAGLHPRFQLLGTSDQIDLVRRCLDERGWMGLYRPDDLLFQISRAKNKMLSPEQVRETADETLGNDTTLLAEVYELYDRQLSVHRSIDFDDCIFKTVRLLESDPAVRQQLCETFQYLMIDEFQDTNESQLRVIELIGADHGNVCVVGDDDQSIYSWRGATSQTLVRFEKIFPKCVTIKLEQNYRCTNVILDAANSVIRHNAARKDKTLWSASKGQDPIEIHLRQDENDESMGIAEKCLALLGRGFKPMDIAILYRANALSKNLEAAMRECAIPYKTYGGMSFFERKEVKDFISYLKLIADPTDRLAFWRVVNNPPRGVGTKGMEGIAELSTQHRCSPFEILRRGLYRGRVSESLARFIDNVVDLSGVAADPGTDLEKLGDNVITRFGLIDEVRRQNPQVTSQRPKIDNLKAMPGLLQQSQPKETSGHPLQKILEAWTLERDDPDDSEAKDHVSLMTVHAAKGLEFPVVFLCGLEENLFPHRNSLETPDGIDEERRIFYVALTRAKRKLVLSHASKRYQGARTELREPSRFLGELPASQDAVQRFGEEERQSQLHQRQKSTISRLSDIKKSLKSLDR